MALLLARLRELIHQASRYRTCWRWIAIVTVAAFLLFLNAYRLGDLIPGAQNDDEARNSLTAYSVAKWGCDWEGNRWPLFFKNISGTKHSLLFAYPAIIQIALFDSDEIVADRTASVVWAILGCICIGLLAWRLFKSFSLALLASILYGLVPWLFYAARFGGEVSFYPAMVVLGLLFWVCAVQRPSIWMFALAGAAWGICFYSYTGARAMVPLYCFLLLVCYWRILKKRLALPGAAVVAFICCLIPLVIYTIDNPDFFTGRLSQMYVGGDHPSLVVLIRRILERYVDYFSIGFLCGPGDPNFNMNYGWFPLLYIACIPSLIAGSYWLFKQARSDPFWRFVLLALATFPLAASMAYEYRGLFRTLHAAPLFILLICSGTRFLWERSPMWRRGLAILAVLGVVETALFFHYYFVEYPAVARIYNKTSVYTALRWNPPEGTQNPPMIYLSKSIMEGWWGEDPFFYTLLQAAKRISPAEYKTWMQTGNLPGYRNYVASQQALEPGDWVILKEPLEYYDHNSRKTIQLHNPEDPPPFCELIKQFDLPTLPHEQPSAIKIYRKTSALRLP